MTSIGAPVMPTLFPADRPRRVLVVEDDPAQRRLVARVLEAEGHEVQGASRGRDVPEAVRAHRPDVILLDVGLADIDGYEVCRRLRQGGDRTPVLFITGYGSPEERVRGLDAGGDDYLVKPYDPGELKARVRALLRRSPRQETGLVLHRVLALRVWPASLALVFAALIALSNPVPGLPGAQSYFQVAALGALASTLAVAVYNAKAVRYLHVFFAFATCWMRSLFAVIGWTNEPDASVQLLTAATWGSFALAILTVYLLTLPFVVDSAVERAGGP